MALGERPAEINVKLLHGESIEGKLDILDILACFRLRLNQTCSGAATNLLKLLLQHQMGKSLEFCIFLNAKKCSARSLLVTPKVIAIEHFDTFALKVLIRRQATCK
jgi:hypothetical protein